jgi:hypothetical protein
MTDDETGRTGNDETREPRVLKPDVQAYEPNPKHKEQPAASLAAVV